MSKLQGTISGPKAIHSNASFEWYSPPELIAGFEHVFGRRPDFDPASSAIANKLIRAGIFFSSKGLETPWPSGDVKALHNPPSPPRMWWTAFVRWTLSGRGNAGLYVAYSIEQLQQSQFWTPDTPIMSFPFCIPNKRVRFWCRAFDALQKVNKRIDKLEDDLSGAVGLPSEIGEIEAKLKPIYKRRDELNTLDPDELVPGEQPTHASAYVLLGADQEETQRFEDYFTCEIGSVVIP